MDPFKNISFVDFETTGLDVANDLIVEIGVARGLHGEGGSMNMLLKLPIGRELPADAAKVNKLTTGQLNEHGLHPDPALACLRNFVGYDTVVAHNAAYDVALWDQHNLRFGLRPFANNFLCTKTLAVALLPGQESYSLGKLCLALGIAAPGELHRAMGDVRLMQRLFAYLVGKFDTTDEFWAFAHPYLNCVGRGKAHHAPKGHLPKHAKHIDQFEDGPQQLEPGAAR